MVTLDIAKTAEEFEQCAALLAVSHPDSPLPDFGKTGQTTFIVRDHEDRSRIRGVIHCSLQPEISHMTVDAEYRFQDASFTLLHQLMEGNLRIGGHLACYHTVPEAKAKLITMLKKNGAAVIGEHDVRLRKQL